MAKLFTFTETRQNLATVLAHAEKDGEVVITKKGGGRFILRPLKDDRSPLDVPGVDVNMDRDKILRSIRESREMDPDMRRNSYDK